MIVSPFPGAAAPYAKDMRRTVRFACPAQKNTAAHHGHRLHYLTVAFSSAAGISGIEPLIACAFSRNGAVHFTKTAE
jgi:hypothetical protein